MTGIGDNSIVKDDLQLFIERVENLIEDRKGINSDIKDVMAEAKACGFDPTIMREVIKQRAMEKEHRDERRSLIDTYLSALGLL